MTDVKSVTFLLKLHKKYRCKCRLMYFFIENIPPREYNIVIWYKVLNGLIRRQIMDFLTTSEMAEKWDISRRRVTVLCSQGRIEGAIVKGNTWLIPENAEKPDNPRRVRKNGQQR